jgi:hypothetical protein
MMQGSPTKNTASEREPAGAGQDDGSSTTKPGLTATERRMLTHLERAGVIYWRAIKAPETRTLRRLVAKGLAVEGTADRGLLAWRVAGPSSEPRAEARLFAHGALAELSAEILAWRRTGVLKGDRLRELAKILTALTQSDDALQQAERVVETIALELAASLGPATSASSTPPQRWSRHRKRCCATGSWCTPNPRAYVQPWPARCAMVRVTLSSGSW